MPFAVDEGRMFFDRVSVFSQAKETTVKQVIGLKRIT